MNIRSDNHINSIVNIVMNIHLIKHRKEQVMKKIVQIEKNMKKMNKKLDRIIRKNSFGLMKNE